MRYEHVQSAPLHLLLWVSAAGTATAAATANDPVGRLVLVVGSLLTAVLAASFGRLTVRDEGERLAIRFGPLPLFRRFVPFGEIESAQTGRTTLLEGWGIHLSPGGGWVWNLWGRDCVDLQLTGGRRLRVGTDDPEGLLRGVRSRIGGEDDEASSPRSVPTSAVPGGHGER